MKKFIKQRPRNGAYWADDEMSDVREMLEAKYSLEEMTEVLHRSKSAIMTRIMKNKLVFQACHLPETKEYLERCKKFGGMKR